jgi:hypothetical protein
MDIKLINERASAVEVAKKALEEAKNRRALLDFKGHQHECNVILMGVAIRLSYLDRNTGWASKAVRGREMLILGAQKLLNAEIERAEEELRAAERTLQSSLTPN